MTLFFLGLLYGLLLGVLLVLVGLGVARLRTLDRLIKSKGQ